MSDLHACRIMRWTLDELLALPGVYYDVLLEELVREADEADKARR